MKKFDLDRPEMSEGPVNINPDHFKVIDLADDIRKQSSWLQYYGKLAINAKREAAQAKLRLKQATSEKDLAIRAKAAKDNTKITENQIKSMLGVDEELIALENELIDAEAALVAGERLPRSRHGPQHHVSGAIRRPDAFHQRG